MALVLQNGMGRHYKADTPDQITTFAKTYIPAACFYAVGIAMTKMSLLAFYYRIFKAMKSIVFPICALSFVVLGWMIAVVRFQNTLKILTRPELILLTTLP